ncbi:Syf2p [Sporobolomyces koalae]|uniref:Syf2p n=1 Tax=Sporobolomyces koalae TaxID=500713 RepID=UPI003175722F
MPPRKSARSSAPAAPSPPPEVESSATDPVASTSQDAASSDERASSGENPSEQSTSGAGTLEDRMTKMKQLRQRMTESARLNRQDVISEMAVQRASAKALAKLERKKLQVEAMGEKQRAQEEGEDLERKKNWEYTIEDSEKWEKKVARKERRSGFEFSNYDDVARIKYKKDLDDFKPDLAAYNAQKAAASGSSESSSQALQVLATSGDAASSGTVGEHLAGQGLYRDANSFVYADHKPTEDQIDRVIGKLNSDLDKRQKRSRKRENEDQGDITWINEKNRMFNKKLARYYDDVTKETRDNFERGTAL